MFMTISHADCPHTHKYPAPDLWPESLSFLFLLSSLQSSQVNVLRVTEPSPYQHCCHGDRRGKFSSKYPKGQDWECVLPLMHYNGQSVVIITHFDWCVYRRKSCVQTERHQLDHLWDELNLLLMLSGAPLHQSTKHTLTLASHIYIHVWSTECTASITCVCVGLLLGVVISPLSHSVITHHPLWDTDPPHLSLMTARPLLTGKLQRSKVMTLQITSRRLRWRSVQTVWVEPVKMRSSNLQVGAQVSDTP